MDDFIDAVIRPEEETRPSRSRDRRERDRRRRQRRRRSVVAVVVSLALLVGAGFVVAKLAAPLLDDLRDRQAQGRVEDYPGPGHGTVEVTIPEGATGVVMGQALEQAGVVASTKAFSQAFTANPAAPGIQPGTYALQREMRAADAVAWLLDRANRVETRVTIPEGFRLEQIVARLANVTGIPEEEFTAAFADTEATGLPAEAGGRYEGWLFPETYVFEPSATPTDMIAAMVGQMVGVLDELGVPAERRQEVLIKASLIERESPNAEASPMMARAIENRIEKNMPLQIDASVAYGLGIPGTELTTEHTQGPNAAENEYNTYAHTGLPPTPIASPGRDSISAVMNPADGPWIFWVTVNLDTGETKFSETYAEHQQYVAELRRWEAENQ